MRSRARNMPRTHAVMALALVAGLLAGCASTTFYEIRDPQTGSLHYADSSVLQASGDSVTFVDMGLRRSITVHNASKSPLPETTYLARRNEARLFYRQQEDALRAARTQARAVARARGESIQLFDKRGGWDTIVYDGRDWDAVNRERIAREKLAQAEALRAEAFRLDPTLHSNAVQHSNASAAQNPTNSNAQPGRNGQPGDATPTGPAGEPAAMGTEAAAGLVAGGAAAGAAGGAAAAQGSAFPASGVTTVGSNLVPNQSIQNFFQGGGDVLANQASGVVNNPALEQVIRMSDNPQVRNAVNQGRRDLLDRLREYDRWRRALSDDDD